MILALLLSLLIGVALGLLGGGGSILTVPILIYALHVPEKPAIATSLLVVGVTSAVAALQHARAGHVVWPVALVFSAAAMLGAFAGGWVARFIPASVILVLFSAVMAGTAFAMWRGRRSAPSPSTGSAAAAPPRANLPLLSISVEGTVVGLVTGLVGAGGGFLVVPALTLLGGLSMTQAVGTSLVVIALKSAAGFLGYVSHVRVDYALAAIVTSAAIAGSFVGAGLARRVGGDQLRRGFAAFVMVMAVYLLYRQLT